MMPRKGMAPSHPTSNARTNGAGRSSRSKTAEQTAVITDRLGKDDEEVGPAPIDP